MKTCVGEFLLLSVLTILCVSCRKHELGSLSSTTNGSTNLQVFVVKGVVNELKPDGRSVVVKHEEIPNYMAAMTMPFRAKQSNELTSLRPGDEITFRFSVTNDESWIDHVRKTGRKFAIGETGAGVATTNAALPGINVVEALSTYIFTNEFGRPVRFSDYRGQAIAFTFFFTRCPVPEYCPRLTRNFKGGVSKLSALPNAPTNWHLFSISFDPEVDTPAVLRSYAVTYGYDSNRWSFLTAAPEDIREITARFGFSAQKSAAGFDHNFLTVVLDATGFMQGGWPIGGDTTDNLVREIIDAASATNRSVWNP